MHLMSYDAQVHWSWSLQRLDTTQWTLGMPGSVRGCVSLVCAWLGHWTQRVSQLLFFFWKSEKHKHNGIQDYCCIHGVVVPHSGLKGCQHRSRMTIAQQNLWPDRWLKAILGRMQCSALGLLREEGAASGESVATHGLTLLLSSYHELIGAKFAWFVNIR